MSMPGAAASLIGDHVPISQDASVDDDNKKNDSATPQPPPKKKPKRVEEEPISQYDDHPDREIFERWFRLVRKNHEGDYSSPREKETRFQYFKKYLRTEVTPEMRYFGYNLFHLADRSQEELDDLTYHALAYCFVDNKLLDDLEEIARRPKDKSACSCCC